MGALPEIYAIKYFEPYIFAVYRSLTAESTSAVTLFPPRAMPMGTLRGIESGAFRMGDGPKAKSNALLSAV